MGGLGSGNHYRWDKRDTTAELRSIDVRQMAREDALGFGFHAWTWWRDGVRVASIGFHIEERSARPGRLVLDYRARSGDGEWRDVRDPVALEWTACRYGGWRPWFLCPGYGHGIGCGRRVALLYLGGGYFRCRHCLRLVYESQRESSGDRGLVKAQRIRQRLGGSGNMMEPFPPKPPRMHWRTYDRLREEADVAEMLYHSEFVVKMRGWSAMLGDRFALPGDKELGI